MKLSNVLVYSDDKANYQLVATLLPPDCIATQVKTVNEIQLILLQESVSLIILSIHTPDITMELLPLAEATTAIPVIMIYPRDLQESTRSLINAFDPAVCLNYPLQPMTFRASVRRALRQHPMQDFAHDREEALRRANERLNQRLQELNTIYTVGKSVALSLDIQEILSRAVMASVNLTRAEEGFIILREGDALYLKISAALGDAVPTLSNQKVSDAMAVQVMGSGRPAMLHRDTKLSTGILVRALLYVPLQVPDRGAIGVLGVVNRTKDVPFTENQLFALSSVADVSAIAIENGQLFSEVATERSRLSAILENTDEPIIVTDTDNHLWLWSQSAEVAFGINDTSKGKSISDSIKNPGICDLFTRKHESGLSPQVEIEVEDGRIYNAQLSEIPDVGRIAVLQDITNLKELDRLKSEFVSTVSHDLRSPLTTVQGYVEMLDRVGPLTDMQHTFIDKALISLGHITALITDLLDIGRIEAGYDLEMSTQDMRDIVQQAVDSTSLQAKEAAIQLRVNLPELPLMVWGNARRLCQVMENLIVNAIKYNRANGWVRIRVQSNTNMIVVAVADSGVGIPAKEIPRIFGRFYRVQSPMTEHVQGTGLGLAIVKSVIEKHKGRVWVESIPDVGSTFFFVLPKHGPELEDNAKLLAEQSSH